MDYFHMKQEKKQQQLHESELDPEAEAEQYPYAKMPKLDLHHHPSFSSSASASALPLFVPEPKINTTITNMSPFPDASVSATPLSRTGSYLSMGQWQELELQALIYRYMLAGAAVPPELLHPIQKSLLLSHPSAPPYFLHHPLHHFQPSCYWGRVAMDPEPGRCRRTDGKKWRCSRDVVGGHKYCERHMHRGRNRSRKPVETPTTMSAPPLSNHFSLSGPSPSSGLLNLTQSSTHSKHVHEVSGNDRSDGHVLRHFFDDWPRSIQETDGSGTSLSISMPANSPSDVSLKLSTGVGDEPGSESGQQQPPVNWGSGWSSTHVSSMGGPLAEALRSSTSTSSPTSVLHQLPPNSVSGTSYVSA